MIKRISIIFTFAILLLLSKPALTLEVTSKSINKFNQKISNKFSRTYCNTIQFGISNEGALAFAIGETNKEFKNNKLNKFVDYKLLKNNIVNDLQKKCNAFDFQIDNLDKLKFEY